jgi:hypothetical protein
VPEFRRPHVNPLVQVHVYAADVLVRHGVDGDGFR